MFIDIGSYSGKAIFHLSQVQCISLFSPLTLACHVCLFYESTTRLTFCLRHDHYTYKINTEKMNIQSIGLAVLQPC